MMTRDQWALFTRGRGSRIVDLLTDFEGARSAAVSGMGGGTITLPDGRRGHYETTSKGLTASYGYEHRGDYELVIDLRWNVIHEWVKDQPATVIEQAKAIRTQWGVWCHEDTHYSHQSEYHALCHGLIEQIAPSDEPLDLLEMLAME